MLSQFITASDALEVDVEIANDQRAFYFEDSTIGEAAARTAALREQFEFGTFIIDSEWHTGPGIDGAILVVRTGFSRS